MKIISCEINGFLGQAKPVLCNLNDDINIITGKNGSGKTTLMKLIWYIISGNILQALKEIPFSSVRLTTDTYCCEITRTAKASCSVIFEQDGETISLEDDDFAEDFGAYAEDKLREKIVDLGASIFLPTFRRIEGGFTLSDPDGNATSHTRRNTDISNALNSLSRSLSNSNHEFVAALSLTDIQKLLLRKYSDLSDLSNKAQSEIFNNIISDIRNFELDSKDIARANSLIETIKNNVEKIDMQRSSIMAPIEGVQDIVNKMLRHSGISFSQRVTFGSAVSSVKASSLSAGEKQILSFICYNAFISDAVIFIDEPELSLHADWQRRLLKILTRQNSTNQFLISTHSPFIYTVYPDREIMLSSDRGEING